MVSNDSGEWYFMVTAAIKQSQQNADGADGKPGSALRDYLALTKPRIVVLLIFTTVTAMVIAAQGKPLQLLTLAATILGGSMSAAGASALNQYIDRDMDAKMSRTRIVPFHRDGSRHVMRYCTAWYCWHGQP